MDLDLLHLWLGMFPDITNMTMGKILAYFGGLQELWEAPDREVQGALTEIQGSKILELRDEKKIIASIDDIYKKFEDSMDDDFNTADAISAIFELVKLANSNSSSDNSKEYIDTLMKKITTLTDILGLKTDKKEEMLDEDIEALIAERQQARKDKNFARADEIRDELLAKGIVLKDTREGVRWSRA